MGVGALLVYAAEPFLFRATDIASGAVGKVRSRRLRPACLVAVGHRFEGANVR